MVIWLNDSDNDPCGQQNDRSLKRLVKSDEERHMLRSGSINLKKLSSLYEPY